MFARPSFINTYKTELTYKFIEILTTTPHFNFDNNKKNYKYTEISSKYKNSTKSTIFST